MAPLHAQADRAERRYAAFISYSHRDERLAAWLHRELESYRTPAGIAGRAGDFGVVPKRIGRCFRDRAELSAADDLAREIREALAGSAALIVLCSPHACASAYVGEEIRYFKSLGRGRRILAAIADGEPHAAGKTIDGRLLGEADECFPAALRFQLATDGAIGGVAETAELIAADFRPGKDEREAGKLKLLAGLLGVGLDDLVQRERVAARRRARVMTAVAALFAALAVAAAYFGYEANRQRQFAETQLQVARAQRIAGDAQLEFARAIDLQRRILAEYAAFAQPGPEIEPSAERTALMALESLNTTESQEGAQALRWALTALWPGEVMRALSAATAADALVGWQPDGGAVVLRDDGSAATALDLATGARTAVAAPAVADGPEPSEFASGATSAGRSPDGRLAYRVAGENLQTLDVLDNTGARVSRLEHEWPLRYAAFSADSRYLATVTGQASMDAAEFTAEALPGHAVRVWEARTGAMVFRLSFAQVGGISRLAASPDGNWLAVGTPDHLGRGGVHLVALWPAFARADACRRVSRNMSTSEWAAWVRDRPYAATCAGKPMPES